MCVRNIVGHKQGPRLVISNIATQTGPLEAGVYELYASCNCRIKVDPEKADDVTPLTGALGKGKNSWFETVPGNGRIGVVAETDLLTGTLEYHWVRP